MRARRHAVALAVALAAAAAPDSARAAAAPGGWRFGTEFDLAPFLNDGWYVSAIAGKGRLRYRLVRTELTTPDFATDDHFEDNDLSVWAGVVDVFFKDGFSGFWVGPGLERWNGDVTEKSSGLRQGYRTDIVTVGFGTIWRFSRHVYLNPWAAVHVPIGGDTKVEFTASTFDIGPTPEASVKLGIEF